MKIRSKIGVIMSLLVITTIMSGCGKSDNPLLKMSKAELAQMAQEQSAELTEKDKRIEELENLLKGVQEEEGPTAAISTIQDGTGRLTFNSIKGKIRFPKPFEYPGSTQAANTSSINITASLSIIPTSNWLFKLDGTTLELNHTTSISGLIKAGSITQQYDREKLQEEVFSAFFKEIPPAKIKYNKLFLGDQWWGLEAQAPTMINAKPAYLRAGMLGLGDQCFTYMFVYQGKQDATKDEAILSLLRTIKMFGQDLRIE